MKSSKPFTFPMYCNNTKLVEVWHSDEPCQELEVIDSLIQSLAEDGLSQNSFLLAIEMQKTLF